MNNPRTLAILTVVFWSFSSTLARMLSFSSPYLLFCLSFLFALVIYLFYAQRTYHKDLIKKLKTIPFRYFVIGLFGYYAIWLGNTESFLSYNSASETTVLNYTWLIFTVVFFQLMFRDQSKKLVALIPAYAGLLLCFISVYMLATGGSTGLFAFRNLHGLLWGLGGGMAYGFFSAYSSRVRKEDHPLFLIAALSSSLIAMLITFLLKNPMPLKVLAEITLHDILFAFAMGVLVDALGYIMWTRSLRLAKVKKADVSIIASIIFVLPALSLLIVSLVFCEPIILKGYFLLSLLFLLAGIWMTQKSEGIARYFNTGM
ncbi:MAG: DMT family transporter [Bacteroidales bacterium]|nr:DMT family transporter [Bacteroidales bacterium]MCF8344350.1 DMT family transporter [Bacteroidales bacterium]MCF8350917.1 DMT family transporter [Bacteroidales bacterium]MCF8375791.1 DMT family transporter [Bacteroidales bacterium]